jgi:hypothetical protein
METIIGMNGDSVNPCIGMSGMETIIGMKGDSGNLCIGMSERWGFQATFCKP